MTTTSTTTAAEPRCPECDAHVRFDRHPLRGQVTSCPGCAVELEVTDTDPLTFGLAPKVEEDWGE